MLAMGEKLIEQASGSYAMMDTDSVIAVANECGGLVACENGPERMPDGRPAVKAMTWGEVDKLFQRFDSISPFDPKVVQHLFKKEDANFRANGQQAQLKYFGIGSKIYTCFQGSPLVAEIVKPSQLVLGTYFRPDSRPWIQAHDCADTEKYPPLIFDDWRSILRRQLCDGFVLGDWPHPFVNNIVMRKVRITTPRQLKSLHQLAPEKARPFSFCMSPVLSRYPGHEKLVLIAPLTSDPDEWNRLKYIDAQTGKVYRLHGRSKERRSNTLVQVDSETAMPQLYGNVLFALQNHHEAKSAGGDAVGLLGRWHVRARTLQLMGTEIDRETISGESFAEIIPTPRPIYEPAKRNSVVNKRTLDPMVIEQLRSHYPSLRRLAKEAKLNFRTVRRALQQEPIQEKNWDLLMSLFDRLSRPAEPTRRELQTVAK